MTPDTILTLIDDWTDTSFSFSRLEVPERIAFGGEQALAVHELVGGVRVVDAMGRRDMPLQWSGMFLGPKALERARYLDGLRINGRGLRLYWSELSYSVVISSFHCNFERSYKLPYQITCTVVQDLSNPPSTLTTTGVDEFVQQDMASANNLGALIGDGPLSAALTALNTAISAVSSFAKASQSVINGVLVPLAAVNARVNILLASVGNTVTNVATVGGILPNTPIAQQAAKLSAQVTAMNQLPQLYNLQSVLGRIGGNLGNLNSTGQSVTVAGGNLYQIAGQAYGDPSAWTTIAKANNLTDPMLSGVQTVKVPPQSDGSGGVLNA
jgi:hypothetical protein